jgi:WD40 repeat protein
MVWQIDSGNVYAIAFSPNGEYLAFGDDDARITFYRIGANITREKVIAASGEVTDLAWSPDGTLISDGRTVWEIHF